MGDRHLDMRQPRRMPVLARIESNFLGHLTWPHQATPGMRVIASEECVVSDSGLPTDTFNTVLVRTVSTAVRQGSLRSALDHFRSRSLPYAVWVGPGAGSGDSDLGALAGLGLREAEQEPGLALDLSRWEPEPGRPRGPEPFEVRLVTDRNGLDDFARVLASGVEPGSPDVQVIEFFRRAGGAFLAPDAPTTLLVGYCGNTPVGTCELFMADGTAGLYNVATLPSYQRRGIATAILGAALAEAVRQGCDLAGLQASSEGLPVYHRMGFRECGLFRVFQEGQEREG
jgi:GNAT superfamily N-acetyltransferase